MTLLLMKVVVLTVLVVEVVLTMLDSDSQVILHPDLTPEDQDCLQPPGRHLTGDF